MQKRLFITTGSISLVNTLTIIEQTKDNTEYEDTLLILSFHQSAEFISTNKKIANLHNFKEILFFKKEKEVLKSVNFNNYDFIYSVTVSRFYNEYRKHNNVYIFDEGPGSLKSDIRKLTNLKGLYVSKFINKFSFVNEPDNIPNYEMNTAIFNEISSKIIKIFNEQEILETGKNALFIGHYIYRKLGDETAINFYVRNIEYLMDRGYTVYFKAHPRDNDVILPVLLEKYQDNQKFKCLKNSLPIEIYDYNFDIVVGSYSGTLVSIPHYRKISAVNLPLKELYHSSAGLGFKKFFALYDFYVPALSEMDDVIGKDKEIIWARYASIIDKKPLLKDNINLKEILRFYPNVLNDVLFGALGLFCNKTTKNQLKDFGRRNFYKMIEKLLESELKNDKA